MTQRPYRQHGLAGAKKLIQEYGSRTIDGRTSAAKALQAWPAAVIEDLGGREAISAMQATVIDEAAKLKLLLHGVDAWLLSQDQSEVERLEKETETAQAKLAAAESEWKADAFAAHTEGGSMTAVAEKVSLVSEKQALVAELKAGSRCAGWGSPSTWWSRGRSAAIAWSPSRRTATARAVCLGGPGGRGLGGAAPRGDPRRRAGDRPPSASHEGASGHRPGPLRGRIDRAGDPTHRAKRTIFEDAETRVIHLTRDPRDFHGSNVRKWGPSYPIKRSVRTWRSKHRKILLTRRLLPERSYIRISYEDICREPQAAVARLIDFFGLEQENLLTVQPNQAKNHVIGNRSKRLFDGTVHYRQAWKQRISMEDAERVLALSEPYASRFGYGP